jgi:hypothetical protein
MIVFDIFTPATGSVTHGILEQLTNYADAVNRSRVGYRFSTAQQQQSNIAISTTATPLCSTSGAGPSSVLYIKLLWRAQNVVPSRQSEIYPNLRSMPHPPEDSPPEYVMVPKYV